MNSNNLLTYLERRQLGYAVPRKNVYDMFIGQLVYKENNMSCATCVEWLDIGNTFACKFSRNKNNLHILGCSTEHGELIIRNTRNECDIHYTRSVIHSNAIFNFAWAEPQMSLVTACGDQTSKLCNLHPSGVLDVMNEFVNVSSVRSVMFCPGSSDVFCSGCQDGSIKIWDARINNRNNVMKFDHIIPNAHGDYAYKSKKSKKMFGISTVIYQNDLTVLSCASMDPYIKLWDLRKSYRQVQGNTEPLSLTKYFHNKHDTLQNIGYTDMITNPQSTRLYASGVNDIIYCYSLESSQRTPLCQYSGHHHETTYSKISISNDGRYLFSGCTDKRGVIWLTDFPFIKKPAFEAVSHPICCPQELSTSDWCADSSSLKLAVSADSMPMLCSILPCDNVVLSFSKTESYRSKSFSKMFTVPIKPELKEKYLKETEDNSELWDFQNQSEVSVVDNLPITPKRQWDILLTKTTSPLASQISPQLDTTLTQSSPVASNKISDVVTPVSNRKRKKSLLSPKCLIDQYLVPKSKREKIEPVKEI